MWEKCIFVKNQYCIKAGSVSQNMKKNIFLEMHIRGMGSVCEEKYDDSAWHMWNTKETVAHAMIGVATFLGTWGLIDIEDIVCSANKQ